MTILKHWGGRAILAAAFLDASTALASVPTINQNDFHRLERDGLPWYPVGYYPAIGTLVLDRTDPDYHTLYIDKLFDNQLNYFRNVFTMGQQVGDSSIPYLRTGPDNAADGRPRYDLSQFDQAHFDRWLDIVSYANARGVVVQISIFDLWHNKQWITSANADITREWGLKYDFYQGANNINGIDVTTHGEWVDPAHPVFDIQKALIEKTIDTLGALPNIIWEVGNEAPDSPGADGVLWEALLADYITTYEMSIGVTPHLVMPRDIPNHENTPGHLHDSPATIHDELVARFQDQVPLISDNDCCTNPPDSDYQRTKAWASLTAGAHLNFFNFPMRELSVLESPEIAEGMAYLGNLNRFIADFGVVLAGMTPSDHLVTQGWCYAREDDEYLIYLPAGGTTDVEVVPGNFTATWFNPRDATSVPATADNCSQFTAPDTADWALHIAATSATALPDTDSDGLSDQSESLCLGTDPAVIDSDSDGLVDGFDGIVPVGALASAIDLNADGYADGELTLGTDALNGDSDGDGLGDADEVNLYNLDPLVSNKGDVAPAGSPDNKLDTGDLVVLTRLVAQLIQPDALQLTLGDMNDNGELDAGDLALLQQLVLQAAPAAP